MCCVALLHPHLAAGLWRLCGAWLHPALSLSALQGVSLYLVCHTACIHLCRSEAWEEWADWLLQQPQEQEAPAAASSSGIPRTSGLTSPVSNLLRSCFTQWCSSSAGSSSSASSAAHAGQQQDPAPAAALSGKVQNGSRTATSSCGQQQQEEEEGQEESCRHSDVARHALVFCYANDLRWYYTT